MIDVSKEKKGAFLEAVEGAQKGDSIIYWVGEFCSGVHRNDATLAEANGLVSLVQKRVDKSGGPERSKFKYIAQVRK